jgi:hypothetical protein
MFLYLSWYLTVLSQQCEVSILSCIYINIWGLDPTCCQIDYKCTLQTRLYINVAGNLGLSYCIYFVCSQSTYIVLISMVYVSIFKLVSYSIISTMWSFDTELYIYKYIWSKYLSSCVRLWNKLPPNIKEMTSMVSFKKAICRSIPEVPKYFYASSRLWQITHATLPMNCSSLKQQFYEKNVEPNLYCKCSQIVSTFHSLLSCKQYNTKIKLLERQIDHPLTLDLLLYGDSNLPCTENKLYLLAFKNP